MLEWLRRLGPLAFFLAITTFLGSLASIQSGWGSWGVVGSIVLSITVLCLAIRSVWPILVRTDRGVTLLDAIDSVGLTDIENREDATIRSLPPVSFYSNASREVLITGATAYRTFDQHIESVRGLLDRGCHVYILILHPKHAASSLTTAENKDIRGEIRATLDMIRRENLLSRPAFHIRFMKHRPPYTAVMVDGDVTPTGTTPRDHAGRVRVQPAASFESQHKGIVIQLAKRAYPPAGGFDYFALDLRRQWQEAMEDEDLAPRPAGQHFA